MFGGSLTTGPSGTRAAPDRSRMFRRRRAERSRLRCDRAMPPRAGRASAGMGGLGRYARGVGWCSARVARVVSHPRQLITEIR
jgi:hypothetical protein